MEKRIRSPNYPALSLPEAIDKTTTLYRSQHTHAAPREVAVKSMGYNSLNGASATAISALHKYGLLEKSGDEVRVSERALRILHPNSAEERRGAILDAAREPLLFAELNERFAGRLPNDEVLRNYLVRKGFAQSALSTVLLAYRKTIEFVEASDGGYDSRVQTAEEPSAMHVTPNQPAAHRGQDAFIAGAQGNERRIGIVDLPGGGYVRIMATPDVAESEALELAEELIAFQRRVRAKRGAGVDQRPCSDSPQTDDGTDSDA